MFKTKIKKIYNPLIIAEIGNNFEGNLKIAKKLLLLAKKAGVDAVKIQIIKPLKFFHKNDTKNIKKYKKFLLSNEKYKELYVFAKKKKITLFSSFFDIETLNTFHKFQPYFKIASCDNNNYELINKILRYNKPVFISTGLLTNKETLNLYKFLDSKKNKKYLKNVTFLYCNSLYPTIKKNVNLNTIKYYQKKFPKVSIGFSDHSIGIDACLYSAILGANVIEKHFTISKNFSSFRDHKLSCNFKEMKNLVKKINELNIIFGKEKNKLTIEEKKNVLQFRRSPYLNKELKKGEIINEQDIDFLRYSKNKKISKLENIFNIKIKKNYKKGKIFR